MLRVRALAAAFVVVTGSVFLAGAASVVPAMASGTWALQHGNADGGLHGIWFADQMHGWAVGEGPGGTTNQILKTVNGGVSWNPATTVPVTDTLNRVFFSDATHGLAVGEPNNADGGEAAVLRTSDGGDTWTQATSGTGTQDLEAVYMFANGRAYASGSNGTLITSADFGDTWVDASAGLPTISNGDGGSSTYPIDAMWWVSATEGWLGVNSPDVAQPGLTLHTTNGTDPVPTWSQVSTHTDPGNGGGEGGYESMMFTDASHGWAVGDCKRTAGTCARGAISKWDGSKWTDISPSQSLGYDMQGIWFVDSTHGWAVGDSSEASNAPSRLRVILFTSDGGTTWTEQIDTGPQPPSSAEVNAISGLDFVFATDICHAWASGGESLILGFTDSCPTPAASQAPAQVGLPAAGSGSPVSTFWNVIAIVLVASLPIAAVLRRRVSRRS